MEYNDENLIALHNQKMSQGEIGKILNVTRAKVAGRLRRLKANGVVLQERRMGAHPNGKTFSRAKVIKMQPNKNTIVFKKHGYQSLTKSELYEQLRQAVENTK